MDVSELLIELFDRVAGHVGVVLDGLDPALLTVEPEGGGNTIAWLIWHLTRVQDHHVAELLGADQVWEHDDWAARFGLEPDPQNTGYGHSPDDVAAVQPDGTELLAEYYLAVEARTRPLLDRVTAADLDHVVDRRWDPPVTLGVRLVSIADDDIQHAGQAAYVRGLLESR